MICELTYRICTIEAALISRGGVRGGFESKDQALHAVRESTCSSVIHRAVPRLECNMKTDTQTNTMSRFLAVSNKFIKIKTGPVMYF